MENRYQKHDVLVFLLFTLTNLLPFSKDVNKPLQEGGGISNGFNEVLQQRSVEKLSVTSGEARSFPGSRAASPPGEPAYPCVTSSQSWNCGAGVKPEGLRRQ
ncbi:hypothetical protein QYF61_016825 [Mycteria americana]|uniref:Uncharacterized protein n=1 Tax=Mycteria americana TaxID=33587 RepID=A0AAN7Q4M4_MYCAM|nr:hypothetical protein QYF61_016825 [Mycteria americana]